jgi:hypothetical protein
MRYVRQNLRSLLYPRKKTQSLTCVYGCDMLYISYVNHPTLTTGRQPLESQGKGNPMKDNARHVPSSTRSCRTPLSRSATPTRRFPAVPEKCVRYAYKMRPNFKTQISIHSPSTVYNFEPLKCTHFLPLNLNRNLTPNPNLTRSRIALRPIQSFASLPPDPASVPLFHVPPRTVICIQCGNKIANTIQNEIK